jgi:hypothetical protein
MRFDFEACPVCCMAVICLSPFTIAVCLIELIRLPVAIAFLLDLLDVILAC